jgi:hypothetical protein
MPRVRCRGEEWHALVAAHRECMTTSSFVPARAAGDQRSLDDARLSLAVAAYLARFRGLSREHTGSDLRAFLGWCAERGIVPLRAEHRQLELFVRWMQETRRFKPSTPQRERVQPVVGRCSGRRLVRRGRRGADPASAGPARQSSRQLRHAHDVGDAGTVS